MKLATITFLLICGSINFAVASHPAESIVYSIGEERLYSPDGKFYYGSRVVLAKTTYSQAANMITEDVFSIDPRRGKETFLVTFHVTNKTFVCSDSLQTFTCEGELSGENWNWTGWRFTVKLGDDQGHLEVAEDFHSDSFSGTKNYFTSGGQHLMHMTVDLEKITPEMYGILLKNLSKN